MGSKSDSEDEVQILDEKAHDMDDDDLQFLKEFGTKDYYYWKVNTQTGKRESSCISKKQQLAFKRKYYAEQMKLRKAKKVVGNFLATKWEEFVEEAASNQPAAAAEKDKTGEEGQGSSGKEQKED